MLACIRQFMVTNRNLRVVLMSATVDVVRYQKYFKKVLDPSEGAVDIVPVDVQPAPGAARQWQKQVRYLEDVEERLNLACKPSQQVDSYMIFQLISSLVEEGEVEGTVLVFLPTYRHLEEQANLLRRLEVERDLPVHILHSSIEIEECMASLQADDGIYHRHKVVLATNIAESSVTIDNVVHVIDALKTNQILFDPTTGSERQLVVNVSQSQANQRCGRTGRTCDGTVWRLCPRNSFPKLSKFETPALQLQSLEPQALILLSSTARAMADASKLLSLTLDAPAADKVNLALESLVSMGAAVAVPSRSSGHHAVTTYGKMIADMPVSVRSARLAIAGAVKGLMRECAVCAAVMSLTPAPILRPFGRPDHYKANLLRYFYTTATEGFAEIQLTDAQKVMANFIAYEFWQSQFVRPRAYVM